MSRGSYTIEGIVAIGVFFILVMLIVQIGFLVLARSAAATTVEAALRRAVVTDLALGTVQQALERDVTAVVPGVQDLDVIVRGDATTVSAVVRFRWVPPGPDFVPITISVERTVVRDLAP